MTDCVCVCSCNIHWFPGKNMTVKLVKKIQKCKNRSEKRTVTKVVKNDSFFNFFEPPTESLDGEEEVVSFDYRLANGALNRLPWQSPEIESLLEADFEMGQYIRERIIPRAVLYYTGEGIEEEVGVAFWRRWALLISLRMTTRTRTTTKRTATTTARRTSE